MSETMNADDFCAFMMPYFSPMAFFGFGDDANGFYSVFGDLGKGAVCVIPSVDIQTER